MKVRTAVRAASTRRRVKQQPQANGANGHKPLMPSGLSTDLARILRPQAAYRWILPYIAAITPYYIETVLRGALAGDHMRQWELFDLMLDTWPELSAINQELTYGLQRRTMIFEAYHEEDQEPSDSAMEKLKLVSNVLRNMQPDAASDENDLDATVTDIMDGWFRGMVCLEVDWFLNSDNVIAPRATFWVHPVCYGFNSDGQLGLRDTGSGNYKPGGFAAPFAITIPTPQSELVAFPPNKFIVGMHKQKSGTVLGGAMLRPLAWWWMAANFSADWCLNLAQVFGLPFRWANYSANSDQATIDQICTALQNMGSNGWAAFPEGTTLELKDAGAHAGRQTPQGELLDRADRYARTLILGQTMTGGQGTTGKGGGQAFGKIEKDVKDDRIDSACKYVAGVINRQLINSILLLNYGENSEAPTVKFGLEDDADLTAAQRDQVLAQIGLPIGVSYLRKKYSIPEPADDEETVGSAPGEPDKPGPDTDITKPPAGHPDPLESKDADLMRWVGKDRDDFLRVFGKDLGVFRDAVEIALRGRDETEQDQMLIELKHELPRLLKHFAKVKKSPKELAKLIAKSVAQGAKSAKSSRR